MGKGSVAPCHPHNPFLESCCLVSSLDVALVNSRWILGGKTPEVRNSVLLLCCAPDPFFSWQHHLQPWMWGFGDAMEGGSDLQGRVQHALSVGFRHLAAEKCLSCSLPSLAAGPVCEAMIFQV